MKMLLNIMFTRFYNMYYKSGEKSDAQYTSILFIGLLLTININSIILFFQLLYFPKVLYSHYWIFALFAIVLINCYFIFVHKGRYKRIVEKYEHNNKRKKLIEWIIIELYILGSFIIWFYLATELRVFHLD